MLLFIQLFLAHIIGDFFLQPGKWVRDKERRKWRSPYLYLHVLVHFALIIAITRTTTMLWPAAIIALAHLLTDGIKLQFQKEATKRIWFFADQFLHLLAILIVCYGIGEIQLSDFRYLLQDERIWIWCTAVLFLLHPTSIIIRTIISKWSPGTQTVANADSLANAGQWIGFMERLLVFMFICLGKWEGVGFLLAAKSVFRFGDLKEAKDMKLTEYVLIGTLLSFSMGILTAIAALTLVG